MTTDTIYRFLCALKPEDELFEVRTVTKPTIYSGYFKDKIKAVEEMSRFPKQTFYITLNKVSEDCYGREQHEKIIPIGASHCTTSDPNITAYSWILIDCDPKRASGVSSSEEEKEKAKSTANAIYTYLKRRGFEEPVCVDSGNGYHLLYHVNFPDPMTNSSMVKNFLSALDMQFSSQWVSVDTSVANPSRISKIAGCMSCKGSNTPERPHRESQIVQIPEKIKVTDISLFQSVADVLPKPEVQSVHNYRGKPFDLRQFIADHNIHVVKESEWSGGTKFVLDECPFNHDHKAPDSALFLSQNGAVAFKCFHNSCSEKTWRDFRLFYEPNAYAHGYGDKELSPPPEYTAKANHKLDEAQPPQEKPKYPAWLQVEDVLVMPKRPRELFETGVKQIDGLTGGFAKGELSVLTGLRGAGKSSILTAMGLAAVDQNMRTAMFSGELTPERAIRWLSLIAAGKNYVKPAAINNYYYVPDSTVKQIASYLHDKFFLYYNDYGNRFSVLYNNLVALAESKKVDFVILDNLMTIDTAELNRDMLAQQKEFTLRLKRFAEKYNCHVLFVAHPRKAFGFLRLEDVSGTADITNLVDNAFIMHRVDNDFKRLSKEMFKWKDDDDLYKCSNVIEIAKDREGGHRDVFVRLYYEEESKRLKNDPHEYKQYGWQSDIADMLLKDADFFTEVKDVGEGLLTV